MSLTETLSGASACGHKKRPRISVPNGPANSGSIGQWGHAPGLPCLASSFQPVPHIPMIHCSSRPLLHQSPQIGRATKGAVFLAHGGTTCSRSSSHYTPGPGLRRPYCWWLRRPSVSVFSRTAVAQVSSHLRCRATQTAIHMQCPELHGTSRFRVLGLGLPHSFPHPMQLPPAVSCSTGATAGGAPKNALLLTPGTVPMVQVL